MAQGNNKFLAKMLERLFAALVSGPGLNCRPYSSRQRIDLTALDCLHDVRASQVFRQLLSTDRAAKVTSRVKPPKAVPPVPPLAVPPAANGSATSAGEGAGGTEKNGPTEWEQAQALFTKLRVIADDARTYEQDTGVYALNIGFPLLSLPPDALPAQRGGGRRVLAPIAFIPVAITIKRTPGDSVEISCKGEGVDLVSPNSALIAWLEQQTGKPSAELFADEEGADPCARSAN